MRFYAPYHLLLDLIKKYNLDGLDIDIQELVSLTVQLRLLNAPCPDRGPSFILKMVPMHLRSSLSLPTQIQSNSIPQDFLTTSLTL